MGNADLRKLSHDLHSKSKTIRDDARKVTSKTALQIRKQWQFEVKARSIRRHIGAFPYSIGYDLTNGSRGVHAEIGPDKNRRQGALGNLLEFGSVHNDGGADGELALSYEADKFYHYLDQLAKPF